MPVLKFIKKPVVIEAIYWSGVNTSEMNEFFKNNRTNDSYGMVIDGVVKIATLEGMLVANVGDWIIKGVCGELYPCKPDIFILTYDLVKTVK